MRMIALCAVLFLGTPARAWEAKAKNVAARLESAPRPPNAPAWRKPGWAKKIKSADDKVSWSEIHGGKTYYFGVGLVEGVDNPGLRLTAAQDRARASLAAALGEESLQGARILDWHLDRKGALYALAVLVR